jgi:hypothetical protein
MKKLGKVLSFLGKWTLRWVFLALPLSIQVLALEDSFLYRPGFWEVWWLITHWGSIFIRSLPLCLPFLLAGFVPGEFFWHLAGLFPCFYISPIIAIIISAWDMLWSPWLWFALVPLALLGSSFPPKTDKASALVHLAGLSLALFVFLHGKMLLEVLLFR